LQLRNKSTFGRQVAVTIETAELSNHSLQQLLKCDLSYETLTTKTDKNTVQNLNPLCLNYVLLKKLGCT